MPASLEESNIRKHAHWMPPTFLREDQSFLKSANRRAMLAIGIFAGSVALTAYSTWSLAEVVLTPVAVAGKLPSGWVFGGTQKKFAVTEESEREIWRQILEAHFARTEKGRLPGLEDFSTDDTIGQLDAFLKTYGDAHTLSLTIIEDRIAGRNAMEAGVLIRGRLTVVGEGGKTATNEIFLTPYFRVFRGTEVNPTGWRLAGLRPLTREAFYAREREEERNRLLGK